MADYSWVRIEFATTDPEIVRDVADEFGSEEYDNGPDDEGGYTVIEGERGYGLAMEVETLLMEKGIAYSRYSDGKYEYDGDEAHWRPGMEAPRVFTRLNNGGRVFTEADMPRDDAGNVTATDAELGALVREWFTFEGIEPEAVHV